MKPKPITILVLATLALLTISNTILYLENVRRQQIIDNLLKQFYRKYIQNIGETYSDFLADYHNWMQRNGYTDEYEAQIQYISYLINHWNRCP